MTNVCRSQVIGHKFINPINECWVKMAQYINPIYAGLERSCPRDSKNVSYLGIVFVQTCLDLILSYGWWGGLSKNLVKPWA